MVYQVPNFLMGQAVQGDFSPVQNALAQWHKNQQFNATKAMEEARLGESVRQFEMQNALANRRFGLDERAADRADQMAPFQMQLLKAQAQEAQSGMGMAPLRMDQLRAQTELARAQAQQARQKDEINGALGGLIKGMISGQAPQGGGPQLQPQSFGGGGNVDPMLIPTQTTGGSPTSNHAEMVDTPAGRMTMEQAQKFGFALGLAGKGDAGKLFTDAANANKLGKEARNDIDKKEEKATDGLVRLRTIRSSFDPDFLSYGTQAKMKIAELQAKAGKLDRATEEKLYRFATFRRDAANNINAAIKDNSGATVTDQELKRNLVELPNAGTGMFDGDDPVTFKAKIDRAEEVLALGIARTRYLRQNGFTGSVDAAAAQVPVEKMRGMINNRAKQIEQDLLKSGLPKPVVDRQVDLRIKQEFGI